MKNIIVFLFFFFSFISVSQGYTSPEQLGKYGSNGIKINANTTGIHINGNDSYLTNVQYQVNSDSFFNTAAGTFFWDNSQTRLRFIPAGCSSLGCATQNGIHSDLQYLGYPPSYFKYKQDSNFIYFYNAGRDICIRQSLTSTYFSAYEVPSSYCSGASSPTGGSYVNFIAFNGFTYNTSDFRGAYLTSKNGYYHINDINTGFSLLKNPGAKLQYDKFSDDYYLTFGNNSNNCYLVDFTNSNNTPYSLYTPFSSTCKSGSIEMVDNYFYYQRSNDASIIDKINKAPSSTSSLFYDSSNFSVSLFSMNYKLYFLTYNSPPFPDFYYIDVNNGNATWVGHAYYWYNVSNYFINVGNWSDFSISQYDKNYLYFSTTAGNYFTCFNSDIGDYGHFFKPYPASNCNTPPSLYSSLTSSGFSILGVTYGQYTPPLTITSLKQYFQSPGQNREEIFTGAIVGKYQSGSGIILSADIQNVTGENVKLVVDIYLSGSTLPIGTYSGSYLDIQSGTLEIIIPYLGIGDYYWKAKVMTNTGNSIDWVEFGGNNNGETDYTLFEGFEPYPYGENYYNRAVDISILTGGIDYIYDASGSLIDMVKVPGSRWDIFESAFDLSIFENDETSLMNAFINTGLNSQNLLQGGSCYGMSIAAVMQNKHSDYMQNHYVDFFNKVGTGTIRDKINSPSSSTHGNWDIFNETLRTISALHITQISGYHQNLISSGTLSPQQVLNTLNLYPDNRYILFFQGSDINGNVKGHIAVPYRTEGNKIYVWDNNYPYNNNFFNSAYNQYIELKEQNNEIIGFEAHSYMYDEVNNPNGYTSFPKIGLININDIYNGGQKIQPIGFNYSDTIYTLSGGSDLYVTDSLGRVSGFLSGSILEEIPGIHVIQPFDKGDENNWKQIYLPQKQDVTLKVIGKKDEAYDLMIAGGDYYTKIDGIETTVGEEDSFVSKKESLEIDFDENKKGDYHVSVDNFSKVNSAVVNFSTMLSNVKKHRYNIGWDGMKGGNENSAMLEIDSNNDGEYDSEESLIKENNIYNFSKEMSGFTKK